MAFNDIESKSAIFNAGVFQTKRIAELQERINLVSLNPKIFNEEFGVYNYEVWITSIDSLLMEVMPKLTETEVKQGEMVRDKVHDFKKSNPVFTSSTSLRAGKKTTYNFDVENYEVMYKVVTMYEKLIRIYLDNHDLNNPSKDDDEGL